MCNYIEKIIASLQERCGDNEVKLGGLSFCMDKNTCLFDLWKTKGYGYTVVPPMPLTAPHGNQFLSSLWKKPIKCNTIHMRSDKPGDELEALKTERETFSVCFAQQNPRTAHTRCTMTPPIIACAFARCLRSLRKKDAEPQTLCRHRILNGKQILYIGHNATFARRTRVAQ